MSELVISQFPGYAQGVDPFNLAPGTMTDEHGPGYSVDRLCRDFMPMPDGSLKAMGFRHEWLRMDVSTFADQIGALYFWTPPEGGEFLLLARAGRIYALRVNQSGNDIEWKLIDQPIEDRSKRADPYRFAMFEPFRDTLYFCDGVNYPLRIFLGPAGYPVAQPMGVSSRLGLGSFRLQSKAIYGQSRLVGREFRYAVTAVTRWGESPAQLASVVGSGTVDINAVTTLGSLGFCPSVFVNWSVVPPEVLRINLYRAVAGSEVYQYALTLVRGMFSAVDCRVDAELGPSLGLDNGLPPNFRLMRAFDDRMFYVGGFGQPNRLGFSKVGQPDVCPPGYEVPSDISSRGDSITQLEVINGSLFVFCPGRIYRLVGNTPDSYALQQVTSSVGLVAPRSLQLWNGSAIFASENGVVLFDGSNLKLLSGPVNGVFERGSGPGIVPLSFSAGAVANDRYFFSYNEMGHGFNSSKYAFHRLNRVLVFDLRSGGVGCLLDGAFSLGAPYKNRRSLVVGALDADNDSDDAGERALYELSDLPLKHSRRPDPFGSFFLDLESPDKVKILDTVEVWYEALREHDMVIRAYRHPLTIELDTSSSGSPYTGNASTQYETVTVQQSDETSNAGEQVPGFRNWNDSNWDSSLPAAPMRSWMARAEFKYVQSQAFRIEINPQRLVGDLTIRRLVIRYRLVQGPFTPYVPEVTS